MKRAKQLHRQHVLSGYGRRTGEFLRYWQIAGRMPRRKDGKGAVALAPSPLVPIYGANGEFLGYVP